MKKSSFDVRLMAGAAAAQAEAVRTEIMTAPARVEPKPKNHGVIGKPPDDPTEPKKTVLPRQLRYVTLGLGFKKAEELYGIWSVRIIKDCMGPDGVVLRVGDTAKLTGDLVHELVMNFCAEVQDPRIAEEAAIIEKAKKLGMPQTVREIAAFAPKPKKPRPTGFDLE